MPFSTALVKLLVLPPLHSNAISKTKTRRNNEEEEEEEEEEPGTPILVCFPRLTTLIY
jgi:hypothetical protein